MKNKIGILGGTFNPIHNGHLRLAFSAFEQYNLNKVWVMISPTPPHKANSDILNITYRIDMVKLAISDYTDKLEFSDYELKRKGYIYTADTLTLLKNEYPDDEFYFIMGGDSLRDIEKWYKPQVVMKNAVILAAVRDDMDMSAIEEQISYLKDKYSADIRLLQTHNIPISSTGIRNNIKAGIPVTDMIPAKVAEYISHNKLYV